jgi:Protein of unknown function (DUF3443)/Immunoglobulin I-set domain
MKKAIVASTILGASEKFMQPQVARRFARQMFGISALIFVLWIAGCGAMSSTSQSGGSSAPAITANPTSITVGAAATATFTAAASGSPTPTVQWMVSAGGGAFTAVPGATSTTLSFATTTAENGNKYEAVFTNSAGSATTSAALLTVTSGSSGTNNVQPITAGGGPALVVNGVFTSVTVCSPGTTNCATIGGVLVDTGSTGLRILSSALPSGFSLPKQTTSGNPVAECFEFVSSETWGPVEMADMEIAGEKASSFPIQIIGDPQFSTIPTGCSDNGPTNQDLADLGANGILGIGNFIQDCGPACASSGSNPGLYYSCPSSGCVPIVQPLASQLQNPVSLFATDNNGLIIELPSVTAAGAVSVEGSLIFGIGTQSNNGLGSATVLTLNDEGDFTTTFKSQSFAASFVDSGSNGFFFLNAAETGLTTCADLSNNWYCPSMTTNFSATNQGQNGATTTVNFSVANADALLADTNPNFVFNNLAGPNPGTFDWGLPFFFGRNVFIAFQGRSTPGGNGPYTAY